MGPVPDEQVALEVLAGELKLRGEVGREPGKVFSARLDGETIGRAGGYDVAVARMVLFLRARLPIVAPPVWNVVVAVRSHEVIAEFSHQGLEAVTTSAHSGCIQRVLAYCPYETLSDAIEAGSQLLMHCCRPLGPATS